jgi:KaiC/GvpD/RAD55 family RecA-like ATPase
MSQAGFWGFDPDTKEPVFILYSDLEADARRELIKPIGGFIFPANTFALIDLPSVPFFVKDLLPKRGKAMLYAQPKTGKSWFCLQLARSVGAGEPFFGLPTIKGKVLYVQYELGEEVLQGRLKATGKDYENVWVGTTFSMKLDSPAGQKALLRAVDAVEPDVVIIDPWYKAISGDENEAVDVMDILDFLDTVIEGYGCSLFLIHHSGKDTSKRGRGSSVLEDWVDSYISMNKVSKDNEPLKIKIKPVFLRHAPLWDEAITAEFKNYEFNPVGGVLTVKQQVEIFVKASKKVVEAKDIFAVKIGSNTSVYNALKELVAEGRIKRDGWGKYSS